MKGNPMLKLWNDLIHDGAFARKVIRAALVGGGVAASSGELPMDLPPWVAMILIVLGMMIRAGKPENGKAET